MKKIFLTLIILVLPKVIAFSQFEDGYYRKLPELDKYVGTWQWESGDSLLTIKLVKTIYNLKQSLGQLNEKGPDINADCLIGWHELSVADVVVQSSMHLINNVFDYSNINHTIVGNMVTKEEIGGGDEFVRIALFRDVLTNAFAKGGSFALVEGQQKAKLRIVSIHGGDFTLPKELFLIKID